MGQPVIQTSFNAGEWAPALNARVDLAKYHSGAAVLRNFFVDYRGGATTRPGSQYILQTLTSQTGIFRLIPFQASFAVSYVLEFGQGYIRVFSNGAPVLNGGQIITGITNANPCVVTVPNTYVANADTVFISNVSGMTQLNGNYYRVIARTAGTITLGDLNGNPLDSTGYGVYTSGGNTQSIVFINTSFAGTELFGIKYAQNVNQLILTHPNHPPAVLTLITATNWTFANITFGATVTAPTITGATTSAGAGTSNVGYAVTAVDVNGQESQASLIQINNFAFNTTAVFTNTVTWTPVAGAVSYNVYRSQYSLAGVIPTGAQYGFVGNSSGVTFVDNLIDANFAICPPVVQNPFAGAGIAVLQLVSNGINYTTCPAITFSGGGPTTPATAHSILQINNASPSGNFPGAFLPGDFATGTYGITVQVLTVSGGGVVTSVAIANPGSFASGTAPSSVTLNSTRNGSGLTIAITWGVGNVFLDSPGAGYSSTPTVVFSGGGGGTGASANAALGAASAGNPTVCGFYQQRMVLAGPPGAPGQMNLSQPGAYYNYNVTNPVQPDNAIQETLTDGFLNSIKSLTASQAGMLVLTDKKAWLVNGGSPGSALDATSIVANPQAYNGAGDLQPLLSNYDILYVQAKGSIVRDITYDFYRNIFTGSDISILSSHLFYGFQLVQWCWAEEPYKMVWAVRNDGTLLTCTFVKDQEMIAWARHDTNGAYKSVISVTESTANGNVDAVYCIALRTINGATIQYIERFVQLAYPQDYISSWQVDAGIGYNGAPATTFSGAQHLAGAAVTGVADGVVINFTMPVSGTFVFGPGGTPGLTGIASASVVTVGLAFLPQIQTLALDLGEPTVQSKRKKVSAVTVRVANALGLSAGRSFASAVPMQDLVLGNVGTMSNSIVTGLVTSDARTIVDPQYDVFGQFCIQQNNPYPASVLGVIPEIEVGDSK